ANGESWVWDTQQLGLAVRLRTTSKAWYHQYQYAGKTRRDLLGKFSDLTLNQARTIVGDARHELRKKGTDPRAELAATENKAKTDAAIPLFADFVESYLQARRDELKPTTYRNRVSYLTGLYFEPFKRMRLDTITKRHVAARTTEIATKPIVKKASKSAAQGARMALLDLFKHAIKMAYITENPVIGTPEHAAPRDSKRDRMLDTGELVALWNGAGDDHYGKIIKLAILLGGRRQEIGGMRWSEIDANGVGALPGHRSKNSKPLTWPLPQIALEIIRSVERTDRDFIFGSRSTDGFTAWSDAKRKLDAALPLAPWHLHDLRRTFISHMEGDALDVNPRVVRD